MLDEGADGPFYQELLSFSFLPLSFISKSTHNRFQLSFFH